MSSIIARVRGNLFRYSGIVGAFSFAASNFALLFSLQHFCAPEDFGRFAILQLLVQLGVIISNAIFSVPLVTVLASQSSPERRALLVGSFAKANMMFCLGGICVAGVAISATTTDLEFFVASVLLCGSSWARWFRRSVDLASREYRAPMQADLLYSAIVAIPTVWLSFEQHYNSSIDAVWLQTLASLASTLGLGRTAVRQVRLVWRSDLADFRHSFREYGSWGLLGAVTTQATSNAHSWIVGFMLGPAVLAPFAAVNLFFRPLSVLQLALSQYERPKMAEAIATHDPKSLEKIRSAYTRSLILCLTLNTIIVACMLAFFPRLIGNGRYLNADLWRISAMTCAIYLAQTFRGAESSALLARGTYRPLAMVTVWMAPLVLGTVSMAALIAPTSVPLLMAGVVASEVVACLQVRAIYRRVFSRTDSAPDDMPQSPTHRVRDTSSSAKAG